MLTYDEMVETTKNFYFKLNINIQSKNEKLAVASLTMAEYAKNYNDKNPDKIDNQNALATVGDSICESYLMIKEYKPFITKDDLTNDKKDKLNNDNFNEIGKKLLEHKLFSKNNDLNDDNKKSYATAFEAIIGFIALNNPKDLKPILDKYLK